MLCAEFDNHESYDRLQKLLATESIHGTSSSIIDVFGRLIPKTTDLLQSFIPSLERFINNPGEVSLKNSEYRNTVKKVSGLTFATYQDILVQVPEGFEGNLNKYVEFLIRMNEEIVSEANKVVIGYSDELAIFLNNVDYRKSIKDHRTFYMKIRQDRDRFSKEMAAFFKVGGNQSRAKLGTVISRFGDLDELFSNAERLEAAHRSTKLSELMTNVNHSVSLLRLIKDKIDHSDIGEVSGEMAKHISEGAYEVGTYVELVSLACFNIEVVLTSIRAMVDQFNRITG